MLVRPAKKIRASPHPRTRGRERPGWQLRGPDAHTPSNGGYTAHRGGRMSELVEVRGDRSLVWNCRDSSHLQNLASAWVIDSSQICKLLR